MNFGKNYHTGGVRNIGSSANEPKWTPEQLSEIAAKCSTILWWVRRKPGTKIYLRVSRVY